MASPEGSRAHHISLFETAARVFDGWRDPDTDLRVLRLLTDAGQRQQGFGWGIPLRTVYHQYDPFLDGGRKVLLRTTNSRPAPDHPQFLYTIDLATGEIAPIFPPGVGVAHCCDGAGTAVYLHRQPDGSGEAVLWDLRTATALATFSAPGWRLQEAHPLADGRRVLISCYRGRFPDEQVHSRLFLLEPGCPARLLAEEPAQFINHLQGCPTDPEIYAYDQWPTPRRPADVVIQLASLDGTLHEPLKQLATTIRPGSLWGGQRDHYLWSPDGRRILSYLSPIDCDSEDHFDYGWWVSALDWRTGEDLCVPYPRDRWGGNFAVTPDARSIISAGGYAFQKLYAIDIAGLRDGWNERLLCSYPLTVEYGKHGGRPLHMPHVLPDGSGVVFSAGWPGPENGVYLAELDG